MVVSSFAPRLISCRVVSCCLEWSDRQALVSTRLDRASQLQESIRLMHKAVHIRVNLNAGIFYDIGRLGPTTDAPKPKEIGERISTVPVGLCDDAVQPRHSTTSKGVKQWKSRSGNIARLRLRHIQGEYSICDSTGSLVEQTNILYYPEFDTKEKRDDKAMDMWTLYESTLKENARWHQRAMRDWRKVRRQWEISLVENIYLFEQKFAIFRPGLQMITVRAAIALTKEDNRREESNVLKPGYTGEPLKLQRKAKTVPAGGINYLVSESEDSGVNGADKERRRLEKDMVIDENEEEDIGRLVFGYQQEPAPTVAPPASNNWEELKRHLDDTQLATELAQIRALREVERRRKLYPESLGDKSQPYMPCREFAPDR